MRVRNLMSLPVFTIREDKRLRAVEEIMQWAHICHVPVADASGRPVGIICNRDLLGAHPLLGIVTEADLLQVVEWLSEDVLAAQSASRAAKKPGEHA